MSAFDAIVQVALTVTLLGIVPAAVLAHVQRSRAQRARQALVQTERARTDGDGLQLVISEDEAVVVPALTLTGARLPRGIWLGPTHEGGAPWHIEQVYTRDDDFDRAVWVRSPSPLAVYATLGAEERRVLAELAAVSGGLRDGVLEVPARARVDLGFTALGMLERHIARIRAAGRILAQASGPPHDRLLTHLRADPHPGFRHQCLLWAAEGPRAAQAARIGLGDEDIEVRLRAARHAGARGVALLRETAADSDPFLRGEAYDHLGHCAPDALHAELAAVVGAGPERVTAPYARVALEAAERFEVHTLPDLVAWVTHEARTIALAATRLLALGEDHAGLIAALGSDHPLVVQAAADALGEQAGPEVLPALAAAREGRRRVFATAIGGAASRIRGRFAGQSGGLALVEQATAADGRMSVAEESGALSPAEGD